MNPLNNKDDIFGTLDEHAPKPSERPDEYRQEKEQFRLERIIEYIYDKHYREAHDTGSAHVSHVLIQFIDGNGVCKEENFEMDMAYSADQERTRIELKRRDEYKDGGADLLWMS